jgi:hypothetical protein
MVSGKLITWHPLTHRFSAVAATGYGYFLSELRKADARVSYSSPVSAFNLWNSCLVHPTVFLPGSIAGLPHFSCLFLLFLYV